MNTTLKIAISQTLSFLMAIQENSQKKKESVNELFEELSRVLEEKKTELVQKVSQAEDQKIDYVQTLIASYQEHLQSSSNLLQSALQAAEQPGHASFLLVSLHFACIV